MNTTKELKEKYLEWQEFKECFQKKYLSERFYDRKIKEFHELKMGSIVVMP